jgi:hypothetical protein
MTSVLRDSLGGNCRTSMIATLNPELEHTDESVTTCRFAQRVARIRNAAVVNAELDPALVIAALKGRVGALEAQVAHLSSPAQAAAPGGGGEDGGGRGGGEVVAPDDRLGLLASVEAWLAGPPHAPLLLAGPLTQPRVGVAFGALRARIDEAVAAQQQQQQQRLEGGPPEADEFGPARARPAGGPFEDGGDGLRAPPPPAPAATTTDAGGRPTAKEMAQLRAEVGRLKAALIHQQLLATLAAGAGAQLSPALLLLPPLQGRWCIRMRTFEQQSDWIPVAAAAALPAAF